MLDPKKVLGDRFCAPLDLRQRYLLPVLLVDDFVRQLDGQRVAIVLVTIGGCTTRLLVPTADLVIDTRRREDPSA